MWFCISPDSYISWIITVSMLSSSSYVVQFTLIVSCPQYSVWFGVIDVIIGGVRSEVNVLFSVANLDIDRLSVTWQAHLYVPSCMNLLKVLYVSCHAEIVFVSLASHCPVQFPHSVMFCALLSRSLNEQLNSIFPDTL